MFYKNDGLIKFDKKSPVYNWFYPLVKNSANDEIMNNIKNNHMDIFNYAGLNPKHRSLYFHIPFCQDICAFCPFSRKILPNQELLDNYVNALIKEIQVKSKYKNISSYPISSIFFGGGTPSILKPKHVLAIGKAIRDNYNLSQLKEFSFEMNAKTIYPELLSALKEIGVTHPRMGVQTFDMYYRNLFSMSATLEQVYKGSELLNAMFKNVCIDILYGFHGQTIDEFLKDLHNAVQLKTQNIDVYPINNIVIQPRLFEKYKNEHLLPTSGLSKLGLNIILNEYMRFNGLLPHNGHGFVRANKDEIMLRPVLTNSYTFEYHESVYGYKGHEIIGFGSDAATSLDNFAFTNANVEQYIKMMNNGGNYYTQGITQYDDYLSTIKGLVLHLPYHGFADKNNLEWNNINDDFIKKIETLKGEGFIIETDNQYLLTQLGWYWYVDIILYLAPQSEWNAIDEMINKTKQMGKTDLEDIAINFSY